MKILENAVTTALSSLGRLGDLMRSARAESLTDYTKPTRAEPIVLVESGLVYWDNITEVMQSVNAVWAGYYLQAASIALNHELKTVRVLQKLNPSRDPIDAGFNTAASVLLSEESYRDGLPDIKSLRRSMNMEGYEDGEASTETLTIGRDTRKAITDPTNLSVGTVLELSVTSNGATHTVPVTIRLLVNPINTDPLLHILKSAAKNITVKERWHDMRAGGISLIDDCILCNDLIDEYMAARIKDDSGFYDEFIARKKSNKLAGFLSGDPSVATATNVMVMSAETAAALQTEIGAPLSNTATRHRIFKDTGLMLLVIIDRQFEQVTIWTRGINLPTRLNIKQMKMANRNTGPDVAEILKAYQLGNAPTF